MPLLPEALLDAIHRGDDPAFATLVAADWLEEHGEPARGRYLRLCAWTQSRPDDPAWVAWDCEREYLHARYADEWGGGELPDGITSGGVGPFGVPRELKGKSALLSHWTFALLGGGERRTRRR